MSMSINLSKIVLSLILLLALTMSAYSNHTTTHHRCQVWKNKCEQHKRHCQEERPNDRLLQSCCRPLLDNPNEFSGNDSGIYSIKTGTFSSYRAWCDMAAGGWMVIMRRSSTDINFNDRLMQEYEEGFGTLDGDFWFGLQAMSKLTLNTEYELRVDLFDDANDTNSIAHAIYSSFRVSGSDDDYVLHLSGFGKYGSINDGLMAFNGRPFLARKSPHEKTGSDCIDISSFGGWWLVPHNCVGRTNGAILTNPFDSVYWPSYNSRYHYNKKYKKYELKIRPKECSMMLSTTASTTTST